MTASHAGEIGKELIDKFAKKLLETRAAAEALKDIRIQSTKIIQHCIGGKKILLSSADCWYCNCGKSTLFFPLCDKTKECEPDAITQETDPRYPTKFKGTGDWETMCTCNKSGNYPFCDSKGSVIEVCKEATKDA